MNPVHMNKVLEIAGGETWGGSGKNGVRYFIAGPNEQAKIPAPILIIPLKFKYLTPYLLMQLRGFFQSRTFLLFKQLPDELFFLFQVSFAPFQGLILFIQGFVLFIQGGFVPFQGYFRFD